MKCQQPSVDEEDRTKIWHQVSLAIGIANVMLADLSFILRKFEGYIPSGLGARLIPVDRLAEENLLVFEI